MKRVLILSNNCISQTNSNGRTLANMLIGFPKDKIAQFTLTDSNPDFSACGKFFCVSDREALIALLKGKKVGRYLEEKSSNTKAVISTKSDVKHKRNSMTMLIRNFIWNTGTWKKGGFNAFVDEFSPEVILLQAGDCAFMFRLARKLSKKYNIPFIIYNSEGYYFKKFDYFKASSIAHWAYPVFRMFFCREFTKAMNAASYAIYSCKPLEVDYNKRFSTPSTTIYTATEVQPCKYKKSSSDDFKVSYLGNLGVGRHESLIEIANILQSISDNLCLDIYGKTANIEVEKLLKNCKGIRYNGFVSYEKVVQVMQESDLLIHVENFSDFYREDLKYAFSTKIADSLASGTPFLIYAEENLACTEYLKENNASFVASNLSQLKNILQELYLSPNKRTQYIMNAQNLVNKNHRKESCADRFQQVLNRNYQ